MGRYFHSFVCGPMKNQNRVFTDLILSDTIVNVLLWRECREHQTRGRQIYLVLEIVMRRLVTSSALFFFASCILGPWIIHCKCSFPHILASTSTLATSLEVCLFCCSWLISPPYHVFRRDQICFSWKHANTQKQSCVLMQVCIGLNESISEEATTGQSVHLDAF